ncbi:hypothetical protein NUSPORA_01297 [Nucleospora cyclopteri]
MNHKINKKVQTSYIKTTIKQKNYLYYLMTPAKLTTVYWAVNSLKIMNDPYFYEIKDEVLKRVQDCYCSNGGFSPNKKYPPTIYFTLSALQILFLYESDFYFTNKFNSIKTAEFIKSMQIPTGAFQNDEFGDIDTRIDCCAILSLKLLELLEKKNFDKSGLKEPLNGNKKYFNMERFVEHILNCFNIDGGAGQFENTESHSAQVFCCISALRTLGLLNSIDLEKVEEFIIYRQSQSGGFCGRLNKEADVCYSFWSFAVLKMIEEHKKEENKIDRTKFRNFIFSCKHENGGFSDKPGNVPDMFHQMFSLAALSLLDEEGLNKVDSGFCI